MSAAQLYPEEEAARVAALAEIERRGLAAWVKGLPYGFLNAGQLAALAKVARMAPVLVRCGNCRFTCAADNAATLIGYVEAGGDYVRDVAITAEALEVYRGQAARSAEDTERARVLGESIKSAQAQAPRVAAPAPRRQCGPAFREEDCGGVFDGNSVTSDADPGL